MSKELLPEIHVSEDNSTDKGENSSLEVHTSENTLKAILPDTIEANKAASVLQTNIRRWSAIEERLRIALMRRRRLRVVTELVSKEKLYLSTLNGMIQNYVVPLKTSKLIPPEDINIIFSDVATIAAFHDTLYTRVREKYDEWTNYQTIGDVFVQLGPFFKLYSSYINKYDDARKRLAELKEKNLKFNQFIKSVEKRDTLESLLIMPVQRLVKYKLLLGELLKNTPTYHQDYKNTEEAFKMTSQINRIIDTNKAKWETNSSLLRIQKRLSNPAALKSWIKASNRFIKAGELKEVNLKASIFLVLFSDKLYFLDMKWQKISMFSLTSQQILDPQASIDLTKAFIEDYHDTPNFVINCWESGRKFSLGCENEVSKRIWVKAIRKAITELVTPKEKSPRNVRPVSPLQSRSRRCLSSLSISNDADFLLRHGASNVIGSDKDLNEGSGASPLFLCWEYSTREPFIRDIRILSADDDLPEDKGEGKWIKIEQNINEYGTPLYIAYRLGGVGPVIKRISVIEFGQEYFRDVCNKFSIVRSDTMGNGNLNEGTRSSKFLYIGYILQAIEFVV